MKLESSKSRFNNQKKKQIKGKIAKFASVFIRNKPNFVNPEICVIPFQTSIYEISPACRGKKQTQNKANTNPIINWAINNISSFMTSEYVKLDTLPGRKTNPIKPKQTQLNRC